MKLQFVSNAIPNSHMTPPGSKYICRTHFLPTCDPSRVVQHAKPVCQLIPSNYCNVHDTGGSHNCSNHVCIQESVTPAGSHVCSNHVCIQESMTPAGSHVCSNHVCIQESVTPAGSHVCSNHVCIQESVTPAGSHVCSNHSRIQESMTPEGSHVGRKRN